MRVLHLVWSFSPLSETFIYDLVRETQARAEVRVLARWRENQALRPLEGVVLAEGGGRFRGLVDRARALLRPGPDASVEWSVLRRALAGALRRFRPEVIHAHFGEMGLVAAPLGARFGIPVLTSFHGYDASQRLREPGWPVLFRSLTGGRNRVLVVSRAMRGALSGAGLDPARISVLYTGKRLSEYPFRERHLPPARFVSVGRLVEKKGFLDAVEAVARLVREGEAIELDVVGDGPLESVLRARVSELGLGGRVRLLGALDHGATRAAMEAADAFLLCSRTASNGDSEGLPTVLLEAQALGLPCVSTTHAGIPEGVPAENHWLLAPEGDVEGIAAAMRRLRAAPADERVAIARRGLAHVRAQHALEAQVGALLELYRSATEGR